MRRRLSGITLVGGGIGFRGRLVRLRFILFLSYPIGQGGFRNQIYPEVITFFFEKLAWFLVTWKEQTHEALVQVLFVNQRLCYC